MLTAADITWDSSKVRMLFWRKPLSAHRTAKLAKLRRELITPTGGGGGGPGIGFDVARTGVASVGFVGFPSVVRWKSLMSPRQAHNTGQVDLDVKVDVCS